MYEFDGQGSIYDARMILLNSIIFFVYSIHWKAFFYYLNSVFFFFSTHLYIFRSLRSLIICGLLSLRLNTRFRHFVFFVFCLSLSSSALVRARGVWAVLFLPLLDLQPVVGWRREGLAETTTGC